MSAMPEIVRIEGRGPVAMALALFLARQGFDAASIVLDPVPSVLPDWLASRSLALSLGSWQLLSRVAALPPAAPISKVEVSLRGRAGRTRIQASDLGAPALGYVLRYGPLHRALAAAIEARPAPARPASVEGTPAATLAVIADGDPGAGSQVRDFDQTALLAEVVAERDGHGIAFERFTDEGPLALLPLPEAHRHALVWCARPAESERRAALDAPAFEAELLAAFGRALGSLKLDGARLLAPLQRRVRAHDRDAQRIAIGNAAQALHPVAGQGLNLGLRDAFELARQLGELRATNQPLGEAVARFRRARRADRGLTVAVTDTLAQAFTVPSIARIESLALGALDLIAPARDGLAAALMFGLRTR
ncbi:MAG: 2-octaprenyl-6-methoxyphenyl hydroxylase [Burkholderiales bacterium]|nr:MAG: 2-octaprenyl-6-methoxyphenyl hydroxylase [Burkholderiales bacterium]